MGGWLARADVVIVELSFDVYEGLIYERLTPEPRRHNRRGEPENYAMRICGADHVTELLTDMLSWWHCIHGIGKHSNGTDVSGMMIRV
jgi:hypothetical protein